MRRSCALSLRTLFWFFTAFPILASSGAPPSLPNQVVEITECEEVSTTCGIQEAIDSLPAAGGVVQVAAGTYPLRRSVVVRSNVTIKGAGAATVLTRGPEVVTAIAEQVRSGDTVLRVSSVAGLAPGDEVAIFDSASEGWNVAHGVVRELGASTVILAEPLATLDSERTYEPDRRAKLVNYFPFIRSNNPPGAAVNNIVISEMTLDGDASDDVAWSDFTVSAVHLVNASDAHVRNLRVKASVGDGISLQSGERIRVDGCTVERNRGHGLHPGSSVRNSILINNTIRDNGGDGIYFCCGVTTFTVTGNVVERNRGSGIGNLGVGCGVYDEHNVITDNVFRQNGVCGIEAAGGRENVIVSNLAVDNSQREPGVYSNILLINTKQTIVVGNRCDTTTHEPSTKFGIEEAGDSDYNVIAGNSCTGNRLGGLNITGSNTRAHGNDVRATQVD